MEPFKYDGPGWYMTRGGDKAWVGCDLRDNKKFDMQEGWDVFCGVIGRSRFTWKANGGYWFTQEDDFDLIGTKLPEPKRIKGWVNVNPDDVFETKNGADCLADIARIACIEIGRRRDGGVRGAMFILGIPVGAILASVWYVVFETAMHEAAKCAL
jgi:hypothetical protein